MGQEISAVVFDVGRVLVRWDLRVLFEKLIEDPAELDWFLAEVVTEQWHFRHDGGRPLALQLPERIAMFPDQALRIAAYAARFNETVPGPVPGTMELVNRLHARRVPLYALTNFGHDLWLQFRPTEPIFDLFCDIVVSGTEKMMKPDPAIYRLAQERFGRESGALFFIDDKLENVEAARACGWQAHHFRDAATLEADLRERGLLD